MSLYRERGIMRLGLVSLVVLLSTSCNKVNLNNSGTSYFAYDFYVHARLTEPPGWMEYTPTLREVVQLQGAAHLYLQQLKNEIRNDKSLQVEYENAEVIVMFTNVDSCKIVILTTTELSQRGLAQTRQLVQAVSDFSDATWRGAATKSFMSDRIRRDFPTFKPPDAEL